MRARRIMWRTSPIWHCILYLMHQIFGIFNVFFLFVGSYITLILSNYGKFQLVQYPKINYKAYVCVEGLCSIESYQTSWWTPWCYWMRTFYLRLLLLLWCFFLCVLKTENKKNTENWYGTSCQKYIRFYDLSANTWMECWMESPKCFVCSRWFPC